MIPRFEPQDDFAEVVDRLEPVTVLRRENSTTTVVPRALRRAMATAEAKASDGRYTESDVVWHLPISALESAPRPGDILLDGRGRRWTVLEIQHAETVGRWRAVARDLAIAQGLDTYVDIEKATFAKGPGGEDVPTWRPWQTGLAAKIQPADATVECRDGRRATDAAMIVFLADTVRLDHTHRLRAADGTRYRFLRSRKADRIDALMEIDVTQIDT